MCMRPELPLIGGGGGRGTFPPAPLALAAREEVPRSEPPAADVPRSCRPVDLPLLWLWW